MVKTLVLPSISDSCFGSDSDSATLRPMLTSADPVAAMAVRANSLESEAVGRLLPLVARLHIDNFFAVVLLVAALLVAGAPAGAEPETMSNRARYRLILPPTLASRQDDELSISDKKDRLEIEIKYHRGIGSADLILLRGKRPSKVLVVFKGFKRIENVTICSGDKNLSASSTESALSSSGNCKISRWKSAAKFCFCFENCCWSDSSIKLSWVDFYRM
jgi:hypothetical protein